MGLYSCGLERNTALFKKLKIKIPAEACNISGHDKLGLVDSQVAAWVFCRTWKNTDCGGGGGEAERKMSTANTIPSPSKVG